MVYESYLNKQTLKKKKNMEAIAAKEVHFKILWTKKSTLDK